MFEQIGTVIIVIVVLVVGAGLGLFAGFVLGRHKGQEMARGVKSEELEEAKTSLENARFENAELSARNAAAQAQIEGVNQQLAFAKSQLAQAQQAEQIRIQQERERAAAEAERKRQADAQAAEVKRAEQEARLKEQSKVLEALAPVAKNLDTLQNKVTQIEEGRKREMGALGAQLKGLNDQQARLDKETSSLSAALRNNKVRGAWGEAQLKNIVESAGLLEHVDFDTQVVVTDADGRTLRPDMIVHLPGGKTIPIDAKVPYADYQRACEIPDTASPEDIARRDDLLRSHAKALREHVRALGEKAYWNAFDVAPDFVVAFIPNEALLQAALEADPTLMDDALPMPGSSSRSPMTPSSCSICPENCTNGSPRWVIMPSNWAPRLLRRSVPTTSSRPVWNAVCCPPLASCKKSNRPRSSRKYRSSNQIKAM